MKHFVPLAVLFLAAGCASVDIPPVSDLASPPINGSPGSPGSHNLASAPEAPFDATPPASVTAQPSSIPPALTLHLNGSVVTLRGELTATRNDSLAQINLTSFGPRDSFSAGDRLLVVAVKPGWQSNASASATLYQMIDGKMAAPEWQSGTRSSFEVHQTADRIEGQIAEAGSPTVNIAFVAPIAGPEPSPRCIPSAPDVAVGSFGGRLFDTNGAPIASGTVEVASENGGGNYELTVPLHNGFYRFDGAWFATPIRLTAHASGYAAVSREVKLTQYPFVPGDPSTCGWHGPAMLSWFDFGGHEATDPLGDLYPLPTMPPSETLPIPLTAATSTTAPTAPQ